MSSKLHFALLRLPLAVWLAVLIAVFSALAPTLSHALVRSGASAGTEICTSTGPRWLATNGPTESPGGQESVLSLDHCPFCRLATEGAAPPPAVAHLFVVPGEPLAPPLRPAVVFFTDVALTPPPRGPPTAAFAI